MDNLTIFTSKINNIYVDTSSSFYDNICKD